MAKSPDTCFVIMPFGGHFDAYYRESIAVAIEKAGLRAVRGDEIYSTRPIIDDVFDQIRRARVVVADVSGRNPNVNYELGVAHAFGKPVIIIADDINDVPFDYRHRRVITYDVNQRKWSENLADAIQNTCKQVLQDSRTVVTEASGGSNATLLRFLSRMQKSFDYLLSKECIIDVEPNGDSSILQSWTIQARTDVSHVYHKILLDTPGDIRIDKIRDTLNGLDLDHIVEECGDLFLHYYILMAYFIPAGSIGQVELSFSVTGYMSELLSKSRTYVFHQNMKAGRSRFGKKKETYIFPDRKEFAHLRAIVRNHPEQSEIGRVLNSELRNGRRVLTLEFDAKGDPDGNYGVEILV